MFNYDNIGEKIKGLAKAFFFIGAIAAVFAGIFLMSDSEDTVLWGLLMIIAGPIISWVSSWLLYGFGQLIENSDIITDNSDEIAAHIEHIATRDK